MNANQRTDLISVLAVSGANDEDRCCLDHASSLHRRPRFVERDHRKIRVIRRVLSESSRRLHRDMADNMDHIFYHGSVRP